MKRTNRNGIALATMLAFLMTAFISTSAFAAGPGKTRTTTTTVTKKNGKVVKKKKTVVENRGLKKGHAKNGKARNAKTVRVVETRHSPRRHMERGPRVVKRIIPLKRGRRVITTRSFRSGRVVTTVETFRRGRLVNSSTTTRFVSPRRGYVHMNDRAGHRGGRV